jgi:hypothetical protein
MELLSEVVSRALWGVSSKGILNKDSGCKLTCSRNTATTEAVSMQGIPGFQIMIKDFKTRG